MKKILCVTFMPLLLMHCYPGIMSTYAIQSPNETTIIQTTTGQELIDLKEALELEVITQEEYDELKLKIIERLDVPVDSTATN